MNALYSVNKLFWIYAANTLSTTNFQEFGYKFKEWLLFWRFAVKTKRNLAFHESSHTYTKTNIPSRWGINEIWPLNRWKKRKKKEERKSLHVRIYFVIKQRPLQDKFSQSHDRAVSQEITSNFKIEDIIKKRKKKSHRLKFWWQFRVRTVCFLHCTGLMQECKYNIIYLAFLP